MLDKDEKTNEIKKVIYGSRDNFKPYKFTSTFNSDYVEYKSSSNEDKIYQLNNTLMKSDLI